MSGFDLVKEHSKCLSEKNTDIGQSTTEDCKEEEEGENGSQPDLVYTEKDETWEFILDDPQKTVLLNHSIELEVFFDFSSSEDLQKKIDLFWEEIKNIKKNADYQNIKDGLGKTFDQYSDDENEFINKIYSTKDMYLEE